MIPVQEQKAIALRAKAQHESFVLPEDRCEPSEPYKRWLVSIGFSEEQVANWRAYNPTASGGEGSVAE